MYIPPDMAVIQCIYIYASITDNQRMQGPIYSPFLNKNHSHLQMRIIRISTLARYLHRYAIVMPSQHWHGMCIANGAGPSCNIHANQMWGSPTWHARHGTFLARV